jgi:hypothetical protein
MAGAEQVVALECGFVLSGVLQQGPLRQGVVLAWIERWSEFECDGVWVLPACLAWVGDECQIAPDAQRGGFGVQQLVQGEKSVGQNCCIGGGSGPLDGLDCDGFDQRSPRRKTLTR